MVEDSGRRGFLVAAGTGIATALAGCGGNAPSGDTTPTPTESDEPMMETSSPMESPTPEPTASPTATPAEGQKEYTGGTLRLASGGPIQTLDPVNAKGSGAGFNQYNKTLMNFPKGDLPPQADLAEDFQVSDDGLTYTFKLREDVQFHDGQQLTAADFVYAWERCAGAEETRNADDIVGDTFTIQHETTEGLDGVAAYTPGTLAVEAVSEYEFRFTLESQFTATFSQIAGGTFAPIPEGAVAYPTDYEQHGLDGLMYEGEFEYQEYFSTGGDGPHFAGVGPFQVDSWSKGDQIQLSRFEDYYGDGPFIDAITYTVIGNQSTQFSRFKNDNLDIVGGIPTAQFDPSRRSIDRDRGTYRVGTYELDNGNTVNYGEAPALDTDYILFNCARTPKPVRQAIAYLVNQERISNDVYKGLNPPAYHLTPPGAFMAREGENPGENYNRHAREGFRNQMGRFSDGWPYGIGEARFDQARQVMEDAGYGPDNRIEVEFTVFSGAPDWDSMAKTLRDKAESVYIDMTIVKADFGTIIGQAFDGSMDMFSLGDGMEWPESDNFLRFIPPYDNPSTMFTRWTYHLVANDVDLGGDSVETVRNNVYDAIGKDFPRDHVQVAPNTESDAPATIELAIEFVTASEFGSAIEDAGYTLNGNVRSTQAPFDPLMPRADRHWDTYQNNRGPTTDQRRTRDQVYYFLEEVNWAVVQELPLTHSITQRLWQPRVNARMAGTMEDQTFEDLTLEDQ